VLCNGDLFSVGNPIDQSRQMRLGIKESPSPAMRFMMTDIRLFQPGGGQQQRLISVIDTPPDGKPWSLSQEQGRGNQRAP
jgi:hypothetical protein